VARLKLSLACCDYDRTRALFDGRVQIDACEVLPVAMAPEEAFHRAFRHQEFDVTELSMSSYMIQQAGGGSPYVGIPVFLSRLFRHSAIYIRTDRGIASPADLKGKTVGVPEYQMTAAMWVRGILQDEYGVSASDMTWRTGGLEEAGRGQAVAFGALAGVTLQPIAENETLAGELGSGRIDALISARPPSTYGADNSIGRLFPDYRAVEEAYYTKTGLFPIMHLVGIRRSLVEQHPWLPVNVFAAFLEAKRLCTANLEKIGHLFTTLPWPVAELERARDLMGEDYWSYGVAENAKELETMARYSFEQGLTARQLTAADLFAASTFDLTKI
jgi:4,5-dihydroxyphthalate decarboxylase